MARRYRSSYSSPYDHRRSPHYRTCPVSGCFRGYMIDKYLACAEHREIGVAMYEEGRHPHKAKPTPRPSTPEIQPATRAPRAAQPRSPERPKGERPRSEGKPVRPESKRSRPKRRRTLFGDVSDGQLAKYFWLTMLAVVAIAIALPVSCNIANDELPWCDPTANSKPFPQDRTSPRGPTINPGASGGGGYCDTHEPFRVYGPSPYDRDNDGIACEK